MKSRLNKTITKLTMLVAGSLLLAACTAEDVQKESLQSGAPIMAASVDGGHPGFDVVCQTLDTLDLMSEDGSMYINKCAGPLGIVPCPSNSPQWGFVIVEEGYQNENGILNLEVVLAPGWYGQAVNWKDFSSTELNSSVTGIPLIEDDWSSAGINPLKNRFNLTFNTAELPVAPADLVMRINAVKINLYGQVNSLTATKLWAKNPNGSNPENSMYSTASPMATKIVAQRCNEVPPLPPVEVVETCSALLVGVPDLNSCMTLNPNTTAISGTLSYAWSTGETTASISVCPTTTSNYSVTISSDGNPVLDNQFTVNVNDIHCGNGNNSLHKVKVCHYPPGNPANMREICIDWSGVPAHDSNYRPAGASQGHDSGCRIGDCGYNPCLSN